MKHPSHQNRPLPGEKATLPPKAAPTRAKPRPSATAGTPATSRPSAKKRRPSAKARRLPSFGDLCEATDGRAVEWRQLGCTDAEIDSFKGDSPFILSDVVPFLHGLGFAEADILRYVPHDGELAAALFVFLRLFGNRTLNVAQLAKAGSVPAWIAVAFVRRTASRRIAAMQNKSARGLHYEAEKAKRRAMAEERRRISRRTTTSPCPTKEMVLDAWNHVHDSKEALVRFGSLMQDLECYVDNSLRFNAAGHIVGRNAGVKGWLQDNLPELYAHYCMVIRYKAAAKKLRQIVGLADPTPVAAVLTEGEGRCPDEGESGNERDLCNYGAEKLSSNARTGKNTLTAGGSDAGNVAQAADGGHLTEEAPDVDVVRARAVYLEAMDGVADVAARVMARIDALCDPERTDEAATLRSWREKYERAITVRRKDYWWERLKQKSRKQREMIVEQREKIIGLRKKITA